jgi:16S rRNA (cytosine1402-N4)-methyltransferase
LEALHTPVLLGEVVEGLNIRPGGIYLDATMGAGGHAIEIARRLGHGRLIGLDRDPQALESARERLKDFEEKVTLVQANFSQIADVQRDLKLPLFQGVVADLGVSSMQLDRAERGFAIRQPGPLDMRMNPEDELTAQDIVNTWPERELANLLYEKGEERDSRRIARRIVHARPIRDTGHLATVVAGARMNRGRQRLHPATKTFLALRIAVNREEEELGQFLTRTPATLDFGGRLVVLSYHSLEDRAVKRAFQQEARDGQLRILTRKPVQTGEEETRANPRARSAKLRIAKRVAPEERESALSHD